MDKSYAYNYYEIRSLILEIRSQLEELSRDICLVFIVNISDEPKIDLTSEEISQVAQFYNSKQLREILSGFEKLGLKTMVYDSEAQFFRDALKDNFSNHGRMKYIVFSSAEGGTGSGRRALIPSFCSYLGIPICSSGAHACSVARHKFHANAILRSLGLRVPKAWMLLGPNQWIGGKQPDYGSKVIVKPCFESMSIGVREASVLTITEDSTKQLEQMQSSFQQPAVVQEFISGYEITVPILELGKLYSLPPVGFQVGPIKRLGGKPRTFEDENIKKNATCFQITQIERSHIKVAEHAALAAFEGLGMSAMGRIDMRIDEDGRYWVFDTNESPPPLPGTSYVFSLEQIGLDYLDMLAAWVGTSLKKHQILS